MAAALLVVGSSRSTAVPLDDFQARSRLFLKRGLVLSGALHLALLGSVLWIASRGGEEVVRLNQAPVVLIPRTPTLMPPPAAPPATPAVEPAPPDEGLIVPVPRVPDFKLPNDFVGFTATGPSPGPPAHQEKAGGTQDPGGIAEENSVYSVSQVEAPPVPVFAPKPRYPDFEREAGVTGRVVMKLLVDADGSVRKVLPVSGIRGLANAAQETFYRWRFTPARMNGRPVAVWVEIPVKFEI